MTVEKDDGLTEEERAALAEEDGAEDAPVVADEIEVKEEEIAAAEAKADPEPAKAEEPVVTEAPQQQAPILVAQPIEDAAAKLAEIDGKKEALLTQFDDGDITAKEYQKQLDALAREERAIERAQDRAELAAQMEQQRLQNDWNATCNNFVESHPVYKDNPRLYKALDAEVRELAGKPETASWSGQRFLDEAHKALKAAFGFAEGDVKAPTKEQPRQARDFPPNLAKVPAADVEDTNGGRFAVLDRMASTDPMAYEETLNKMSQTERDAYLSS